jgi:hypothetical protein
VANLSGLSLSGEGDDEMDVVLNDFDSVALRLDVLAKDVCDQLKL